ncbi:hypothetical protein N7519_006049 [Penicillium mononematosum]|uniref:uncharacterized protein n=1 Tax=Penicillium mononematosum TaxID=268346 RepID=UPI0025468D1D|nr:uncharacterized protein N7519_006049 [Penicillium mononematosum]KAJ6184748.1 hypothetical protein N7519_006049 [Penicillium mononematosum]
MGSNQRALEDCWRSTQVKNHDTDDAVATPDFALRQHFRTGSVPLRLDEKQMAKGGFDRRSC